MSYQCLMCGQWEPDGLNHECVYTELAELKAENARRRDLSNAEIRDLRAEVERLKSQDLTHAVIAADVELRNRCDELKALAKVLVKRYAGHTESCRGECSCGLNMIKEKVGLLVHS